jgi:putative ABC transport system ATP-binding protein
MEIALMRDPYLLLLDEHTASLDQQNARICMAATEQVSRTMGLTILMATHNLGDAIYFGNRMLILKNGKIAADLSGSEKSNTTIQQLLEITGMLSAEPLN